MRLPSLISALALAVLLTACADTSSTPDNNASANALSLPDKSDNPPVTMSGYVDTSATAQVK